MVGIHNAVKENIFDLVESYLKGGGYVDYKDANRNTPLHTTAREMSSPAIINLLLSYNANVNACNDFSETPLSIAIYFGHIEAVKIFIRVGVNINERAKYGRTPLMMAVEHHHNKIIQLLLALGVDPNIPNNSGSTPLMRATDMIEVDVVQMLLAAGANPCVKDDRGRDALGRTCRRTVNLALNLVAGGACVKEIKETIRLDCKTFPHLFSDAMLQFFESLPLPLQTITSFNLRMQSIREEFAKIREEFSDPDLQ